MTLYQLIPSDLHGSFFFKVIQSILRRNINQIYNDLIKYSVFLDLRIEENFKWADLLNKNLRKCHEKLENNKRSVKLE